MNNERKLVEADFPEYEAIYQIDLSLVHKRENVFAYFFVFLVNVYFIRITSSLLTKKKKLLA